MAQFKNKRFQTYDFDGPWRASFGEPEQNFRCFVYGNSGQGKTDFVVQLAKYLSEFGKVYYNSFEEGESLSLQLAFGRHNLWEKEGKIILGDRENFDLVMRRMSSKNSPRFCIIDSLDYMRMTMDDYQRFVDELPHKAIIIISWAEGRKPKTQAAKDIEYMCDVKIEVREYKALMRCRFGGNAPFIIYPEYWEKKRLEAEAKLSASAPTPAPKPTPAKRPKKEATPELFQEETPDEEPDELADFFTRRQY